MIKKVLRTIEKYHLLERGERVLAALSGGPDSTALLMALAEIAPEWNLTLCVAHFNHGLRGRESNADEKISRNLAKKLGLPFFSANMNQTKVKKGISPEDFTGQRYTFRIRQPGNVGRKKSCWGITYRIRRKRFC